VSETNTDMESTPPLARRLLDVFFSPAKVTAVLAKDPRWVGALLVSLVLVALATWLVPAEILVEAQRRVALDRGVDPPPLTDRTLQLIRVGSIIGAPVMVALLLFAFAGIYTVIFAFVLGDEGKFKQYLAVLAHASFIPSLLALPLVPLRISTGDPQLSLNLSSLLPFLSSGYLLNVLRLMDLTQIWSSLVVAVGAHQVDRRRSFMSAAAILIGLQLAVALVFAALIPG
jgi:hypothetical protein